MVDVQQVLLVAGRLEVIEVAEPVLRAMGMRITYAYSHYDAIFSLQEERFDLVLIDGVMHDRKTQENTPMALATIAPNVPYVLLDAQRSPALPVGAVAVAADLTPHSIEAALSAVRRVPSTPEPTVSGKLARSADELNTLFSLGQSLTETLDMSEVLNRVVSAAQRLTHADEGMILLPGDDDDHQLYLRAKVGLDDQIARTFRVKTDDTLAGQVYLSGRSEYSISGSPQKVKTEHFAYALLYVPIISNGQTLGVLGVNNRKKGRVFNDQHRYLLENMAAYAAIAIQNARTLAEAHRRQHELAMLAEASMVLSTATTLPELLTATCQHLLRVSAATRAELIEEVDERIVALVRYQRAILAPGSEYHTPLGDDLAELATINGPVWYEANEGPIGLGLSRLGLLGALIVPFTLEDGSRHIFSAGFNNHLPEIDEADVAQVCQVFRDYGPLLVHRTDPDALHDLILSQNIFLEADVSSLSTFGDDGTVLLTYGVVGARVWPDAQGPTYNLADYPTVRTAFSVDVPQRIHADEVEAPLAAYLRTSYGEEALLLPVRAVDQPRRVVLLSGHNWEVESRIISLTMTVMSQAAVSLENVRLVRDLNATVVRLQETQQQLLHAARMKAMGELAAAIAHQINNPLTTIIADAELLLEDTAPTDRNYDSVRAILRAGQRAASVARRLTSVSRADKLEAARQPIDVMATLQEAIMLARPYIENDGIELMLDLPDAPLPPVWAARDALNDVWLNLLINAHDVLLGYQPARIGVSIQQQQGGINVTIWDTGPGVPSEVRESIFDAFYTTKPVGQGTGLGLHISREVVENIGGTIDVREHASGGAEFSIFLPTDRTN